MQLSCKSSGLPADQVWFRVKLLHGLGCALQAADAIALEGFQACKVLRISTDLAGMIFGVYTKGMPAGSY